MKLKNELKINKKNITKKRIIKKKRNVNKKSLKKMRGKNKKTLKRNYVKKGGNNYVNIINNKIRDIINKRVNYFKLGDDYYERYPKISFDDIEEKEERLQEYIGNLRLMKKKLESMEKVLVEPKNQDKKYASVDNTLKTKEELVEEIMLKMKEIQNKKEHLDEDLNETFINLQSNIYEKINSINNLANLLDKQKQKLEQKLEKNEFIILTNEEKCINVKDSGDNCRKYIKIDKKGNIKFCMSTTMSRNMTKRMYRGKGSCSSSNDIIKNEDIHLIEDEKKQLSMEYSGVVKGKTYYIYKLAGSQDNHKTKTNPINDEIKRRYLPVDP